MSSAASGPSASASTSGACSSTSGGTSFKALLAAGAVGARVAALVVVAQGAVARIAARLITVTALRLALILIQAAGSTLVLIKSPCARLVCLDATPVLAEPGLICATLLRRIAQLLLVPVLVELGLIARLVEPWLRRRIEVVGPVIHVVAIEIVVVDVISIDVIPVDVISINVICIDIVAVNIVAVDVIRIDVIAVVIVISIHKGIRVRYIDIAVICNRGVVPATSPGVVAPSAAASTAHGCSDGDTDSKREQTSGNHFSS